MSIMRSLVQRSISIVLVVTVVMISMAAHHEKENDALASLKEAFDLSRESWKATDVETHFSTVHPAGGGINANGSLWTMQDVDYERARGWAKSSNENRESQIDGLDFNIQGNTAVVTFNEIVTRTRLGGIGAQIVEENQVIKVMRLVPKLPAFEAGIKAGDFFVKIDGVEVSISEEDGKTFRDYFRKVIGEIGTSVTLTIQRGEGENQKIFDVTITRKELPSAGSRERRTAVSQVWTRTAGKWLRLHEHTTHITADLRDMTSRFIEEVWNKGDMSVVDELCAPDIVRTPPPSIGVITYGIEELKQSMITLRTAFPDAKITVNRSTIARANKVTVQWTITGTHQGEFLGVAATGKKIKTSGISILTFAKGKIVDYYSMWDDLHIWRQLGVDPPQPPAADSSTAE